METMCRMTTWDNEPVSQEKARDAKKRAQHYMKAYYGLVEIMGEKPFIESDAQVVIESTPGLSFHTGTITKNILEVLIGWNLCEVVD